MRDSDTTRSFSSNRSEQALLQREDRATAAFAHEDPYSGKLTETRHQAWLRAARQAALSIFIVAYFVFVSTSTLPKSDVRKRILSPAFPVLSGLGLLQNWKLFCPTVRSINYHPAGVITYSDGINEIWQAPRFDRMNLLERVANDKLRRFYIDSLPWSSHREYWVNVCEMLLRKYDNAVNPPECVMLQYRWGNIPPPEQFVNRDRLPPHNKYFNFCFYHKQIGQEP